MTLEPSRRLRGIERTLIRQIFDSAPPDAINLGLGQPDLGTPASIALAGVAAIAGGRTGYTSTAGDPELRRAIAARYPTLANGPENVVVTVGAQEALFAACLALVDEGDEVLVPDPGYPAYPVVPKLIGARSTPYTLRRDRGFRLVAEDVAQRLGERTRLVVLSSPSNPTGACHAADELEALLEVLARRGIPWISDEIYEGFRYTDECVSPARLSPGNGLVISGLSKDASMTGWRIGWVVGPEGIVERITAAHQYLVTCAPSISQSAALAAFGTAGATERTRHVERYRRRRELMAAELAKIDGIRFEPPDGAFYFFVDVSAKGTCLDLGRRILERQNVVTIPGCAFGEAGKGHLRLSFAASEDDIRRGVRRIGSELAGR